MTEAWRPMENAMSDVEILEYALNGVEYSIASSTNWSEQCIYLCGVWLRYWIN